MKDKVLLVILDGFDYQFIIDHAKELPFFAKLTSEHKLKILESVVPADSIPSWTTIYTGLNPAEHGVIESIDYLNDRDNPTGDASVIKGNAFWDKWSADGKKVLIYNPFIAYPAWEVNGAMICGPVFEGGEISTNSKDVDVSKLPPLGGLVDHPNKHTMVDFFNSNMKLTQEQFDSFDCIFSEGNYDCAMLGILTSDRMQHFLWKYCDETDRCYVKKSPLKSSLEQMYQLMEKNVKSIFEKYGDEYNIVVISDHGHGRRCQKTFYINQWLINNGFIPDRSFKNKCTEFAKNGMLTFLAHIHCVQGGSQFFKRFKFAQRVKSADYVFNTKKKKKVYAPSFDGTNPFGGIELCKELFASEEEYEATRDDIINKLCLVEDHGKRIMLWVKKREEIYQGDNVRNYPDIIYRMKNDYGVDRSLFGGRLFGISAFHEVISGGHRYEGVIMSNSDEIANIKSVLDIHGLMVKLSRQGAED